MNKKYLRVTSSRAMRVLRLDGTVFLGDQGGTDLPVEWQGPVAAARACDACRLRFLMPFICALIRSGRKPSEVTQSDYEVYCIRVDDTSSRKNKDGSKQCAQREWNFFAKRVDLWPKTRLTLKKKREGYLLPDDQLPPAWAEFEAKKEVPFRGNRKFGKRRRRLKEITVESRDYTFRRVVSAAIAGGIDPNRLQAMAAVCDREVLETAYNFILDRNPSDVEGTCDVSRIAGLMYAAAEQWVGVTGKELEAHQELLEDFECIQQGMAEKNQRLLTKFTTDAAIAAFLKTPKRVMDEYADKSELTTPDCNRMQMATAMAILTRVLVRVENLKTIEKDKQLVECGYGPERRLMLIFGEKESKTNTYQETLLSPRVAGLLDTYMTRAWLKLKRGKTTNCLFPASAGGTNRGQPLGVNLPIL